jgi:hypothetical protein
MRPNFRWSVLLLVMVLPIPAADKGEKKKKKGDKDVTGATTADYAALARTRTIVGTLTNVEADGKSLTFHYHYQSLVPKNQKGKGQNLSRRLEKLVQRQEQIMRIADPVKRIQRLQQLAAQIENLKAKIATAQASAYKATPARKEFDLQAIDDVKVRLMELPVEYDDDGHVIKYSPKQRKELKGKGNLPGYRGNWENLTPGQTVKLYLVPPKKKAADKGKGKDKVEVQDKAAFDLLEEPDKPLVKMIVVLAEANADTTSGLQKKRK